MDYLEYKNSFRNLVVSQKAKELTRFVYKITKSFPKEEIYALTSQLKRASYSILSNIAEGNARNKENDRRHFFNISMASLIELDCFLDLSLELQFITEEDYKQAIELVNKTAFLLQKFINSQSQLSQKSQSSQ